jgi:hypothetical protein
MAGPLSFEPLDSSGVETATKRIDLCCWDVNGNCMLLLRGRAPIKWLPKRIPVLRLKN